MGYVKIRMYKIIYHFKLAKVLLIEGTENTIDCKSAHGSVNTSQIYIRYTTSDKQYITKLKQMQKNSQNLEELDN